MLNHKFVFVTGPMFSGKTSKLIQIARTFVVAGKNIKIYRPKLDTRYGDTGVFTHDQVHIKAKAINGFADILPDLHNGPNVDAIFIDEVQFLHSFDLDKLFYVIDQYGAFVFVAGLALDAFRKPFEISAKILPYARVITMTAVCDFCKEYNAIYTFRLPETCNSDQILLGEKDIYRAACHDCYLKHS